MLCILKGFNHKIKIIYILTFLLATSCSHTISVNGEFPIPIGQVHPITVAVFFSDDFTNFTYHENRDDRDEWNINTGLAQKKMFETVLASMFKKTVNLSIYPDDLSEDIDLVIIPEVRELQFSMPRETAVNVFEVWIKYDIHAYNKQGIGIADWVITAYGKTPTAFLKSKKYALKQAINIALRDAGATLYIGFKQVPELQEFFANKQHALLMKKSEASIVNSATQ